MSASVVAAGAAAFAYYVYLRQKSAARSLGGGPDSSEPPVVETHRNVDRPPDTWTEALYLFTEAVRYLAVETLGRWHALDLFFGLAYLSRRDAISYSHDEWNAMRAVPLPVGTTAMQDLNLLMAQLKEIRRYMLYCQGMRWRTLEQQLQQWNKHLGIGRGHILKHQATAGLLRPAFVLIRDQSLKTIILCVRGTQTLKDMFTSLTGAGKPHHILLGEHQLVLGYSHLGMLAAARWILHEVTAPLTQALADHPGYRLRVVGHSMGGGTAAILTMMLRERMKDASLDLHCYAIACPACLTLELARACSGYVTSVVNSTDVVPTFCAGAADALREEVMQSSWLADVRSSMRNGLSRTLRGSWQGMGWTARSLSQPFAACYTQRRTTTSNKFPTSPVGHDDDDARISSPDGGLGGVGRTTAVAGPASPGNPMGMGGFTGLHQRGESNSRWRWGPVKVSPHWAARARSDHRTGSRRRSDDDVDMTDTDNNRQADDARASTSGNQPCHAIDNDVVSTSAGGSCSAAADSETVLHSNQGSPPQAELRHRLRRDVNPPESPTMHRGLDGHADAEDSFRSESDRAYDRESAGIIEDMSRGVSRHTRDEAGTSSSGIGAGLGLANIRQRLWSWRNGAATGEPGSSTGDAHGGQLKRGQPVWTGLGNASRAVSRRVDAWLFRSCTTAGALKRKHSMDPHDDTEEPLMAGRDSSYDVLQPPSMMQISSASSTALDDLETEEAMEQALPSAAPLPVLGAGISALVAAVTTDGHSRQAEAEAADAEDMLREVEDQEHEEEERAAEGAAGSSSSIPLDEAEPTPLSPSSSQSQHSKRYLYPAGRVLHLFPQALLPDLNAYTHLSNSAVRHLHMPLARTPSMHYDQLAGPSSYQTLMPHDLTNPTTSPTHTHICEPEEFTSINPTMPAPAVEVLQVTPNPHTPPLTSEPPSADHIGKVEYSQVTAVPVDELYRDSSTGGALKSHVLLEVDNQVYGRVRLCKTMVLDHFIPAYLKSLDSILHQLEEHRRDLLS